MNRCTLGVYEKSMPAELDWKQRLLLAQSAGFDYLEMSIDESDARLSRLRWSRQERLQLLQLTREIGFPVRTMCLSAHRKYPLGSPVRETEQAGLQIMDRALELADDLGIRLIQLAGYDVYYNAVSNADTGERFRRNIILAAEKAARLGIVLGFETMETDFMNTVEKAMAYVRAADSPYLQIYPDIGNVSNATDDLAGDLAAGRGHLAAAHLKETLPGIFRDLKFGEGRVDFALATDCLLKLGVRMYTAEFWDDGKGQYAQNLQKSHDFLRPYLQRGE